MLLVTLFFILWAIADFINSGYKIHFFKQPNADTKWVICIGPKSWEYKAFKND